MEQPQFFAEGVDFSLPNEPETTGWLLKLAAHYGKETGSLNYIFCSDAYLLQMNMNHLGHDYYTDIITFDQSDSPTILEGDIFISVERVGENAQKLTLPFEEELRRVMAHGMLHLIGYGDKTPEEAKLMRQEEDRCLAAWVA